MVKMSCDFRCSSFPPRSHSSTSKCGFSRVNRSTRIASLLLLNRRIIALCQMRLLIDQIRMQQGQIVALEGKTLQKVVDKTPVAAVVIMACNGADYLERTINSVLKYQSSVASKFPLFVSQDGSDPAVRSKAVSYEHLIYIQHLDSEPVHPERPGELIAYYKIARHYKWALDQLFYYHNFNRVIILQDDMEIAPDFFNYFEAAAALLDKDKYTVSIRFLSWTWMNAD